MYQSSLDNIRKDLEYHIQLDKKCKAMLKKTEVYRGCSLSAKQSPRGNYYTINQEQAHDQRQRYVGKGNKEIAGICTRHILETLLKRIAGNLQVLSKAESDYMTLNPNEFRAELPIAYRDIPECIFDITETVDMSRGESAQSRNQDSPVFSEGLKHVSTSGIKLRSKAEVLLTYIFDKLSIRYAYEQPLTINEHTFYPDFTITSPDGTKQILLEHFGMMNDVAYRKRASEKIASYIMAEYIPDKDIIFTFDDYDGVFDGQHIESKLRAWIAER